MDKELLLFLVAYYGNDCVVAGNIVQTCKALYKHRKQIVEHYTVIIHDKFDTTYYELNGVYHREDGPAYQNSNQIIWIKNGKRFNPEPDVPGFQGYNIQKYYDNNGNLHREYGPAVVRAYGYGDNEYWIHGKRIMYKTIY